jgi:tetrahydromethanopterin S-methyltransferase subunit B
MAPTNLKNLLHRVALRQHAASLGRWIYRFWLGLAVAYLLALLAARLLAVIPDVFTWQTLLFIPAAAIILAMAAARRPNAVTCAHLVDQRAGTKDLFLTTALLDRSPGQYAPLVADSAQRRVKEIRPATVVPFDPWSRTGHVTVAMLALLTLVLVPFQLDPFGKQQHRIEQEQRAERLAETRRQTSERAEALRSRDVDSEHSKEVQQALGELMRQFNQMKPQSPDLNSQQLREQRRRIGEMWQRQREDRLADALNQQSTTQRFGGMQTARTQQWHQDIAAGKVDSIRDEISQLQQLAEQMRQTQDPDERREMRRELEQRMRNLNEFCQGQGAGGLGEAMSRAMQQLDLASGEGLSDQAMQALAESLDLSQSELQQLAQQMSDMQSLEEALEALRQAQQLSDLEPLDGSDCQSCQSMGDYAALYRKLMVQCQGQGNGPGMGGAGTGKGNVASEDPTQSTQFQSERAPTALQAGRVILEWRTRGVATTGEADVNYEQSIAEVRQNVSEAILQEDIPAGYHDDIREYFDTIDQAAQPSP